jgi:hypothetical protein
MTITYTWKITGIKVKDVTDNKPSAVVQTYWQKTGRDEAGNEGTFSGATPFTVDPTDAEGPFVPFEELTEQMVIDWIKSVVVGGYEEHVNGQIQKQIDEKISPIAEPSLPWALPAKPTTAPTTPPSV